MLHIDSDGWETPARNILSGFFPLDRTRQYFECTSVKEDWRGLLPEGYRLAAVDEQLTKQGQLANIDYLLEELSSERASVSDFLNHSFGFAILHQNDLAAWCLSEYNLSGRCEVGVATVDAYQRRGLGTVASLALVEHALVQGYSRVGWHCWKWNLASSALARRSGFAHTRDYPVFFCILNRAVQFAFHGNDARAGGDDHAAVSWYRRSISAPEGAPAWAFYGFARSLARLNQPGSALDALRQAVARGYNDFRSASQEPDLKELRKLPEWNTIIPRNLSNELEMTL